jgi:precorrin-2 dehydrogenase / sirohydrochlorin ferrochelatase
MPDCLLTRGTLWRIVANSNDGGCLRYYPINLDIQDQPVVIVGGGAVAGRKATRLAAAGARVTVISPNLNESLAALVMQGTVLHEAREYRDGDLDGALLAFAATDDKAANQAVAAEAKRRGILVDVVDSPRSGSFTTPAVVVRGDLMLTVSTGGASPALSRSIVGKLEQLFGPEYEEAVMLLAAAREKILTEKGGNAYNARVFAELAALDLPALIKNGQRDVIDQLLLKLSIPGPQTGRDRA